MIRAGIKEARQHFTEYLARVEAGEEIIITKRSEPIARILPIHAARRGTLISRKELRDSIKATGKALSEEVMDARREETY